MPNKTAIIIGSALGLVAITTVTLVAARAFAAGKEEIVVIKVPPPKVDSGVTNITVNIEIRDVQP